MRMLARVVLCVGLHVFMVCVRGQAKQRARYHDAILRFRPEMKTDLAALNEDIRPQMKTDLVASKEDIRPQMKTDLVALNEDIRPEMKTDLAASKEDIRNESAVTSTSRPAKFEKHLKKIKVLHNSNGQEDVIGANNREIPISFNREVREENTIAPDYNADLYYDEDNERPAISETYDNETVLCSPCRCGVAPVDQSAFCSYSNLVQIPATLPGPVRTMNMSYNAVEVFNLTDIRRYPLLEFVDFRWNKIKMINFENVTSQLSKLDFSYNNFSNLAQIEFKVFPRLTTLVLCHNKISHIPESVLDGCTSLVVLDLSSNSITYIHPAAFDSLANLRLLDLSHNQQLGYTRDFFTPILFHELGHLTRLVIHGSSNGAQRYPSEVLGVLPNLTSLSIDGLGHNIEFGAALRNLTGLETLNFSPDSKCRITNISSSFFENTQHIKSVGFYSCGLLNIHPSAFSRLPSLAQYTVSHPGNNYPLQRGFADLKGLNGKSLTYLQLSGFHPPGMPCQGLGYTEGLYIKGLAALEKLDLCDNYLVLLEDGFLQGLPKTLKVLILRNNKFTMLASLWTRLSHLPNLWLLDVREQNVQGSRLQGQGQHQPGYGSDRTLGQLPSEQYHKSGYTSLLQQSSYSRCRTCKSKDERRGERETIHDSPVLKTGDNDANDWSTPLENPLKRSTVTPPPNLRVIRSARYLFYGDTLFFYHINSTSLKEIHLRQSFLAKWGRGIMPESVEMADLSENYCDDMDATFIPLKNSIQYLCIAKNHLGPVIAKDSDGRIFANANQLRVLDIGDNIIFKVHGQFLRGLGDLTVLSISENKLHVLEIDFSHTPNLTYLDLSKNSIQWISRQSRCDLDAIASRHPLKIDLTCNPLPCTCDGIEILEWLEWTKVHLVNSDMLECLEEDQVNLEFIGDVRDRINRLRMRCSPPYLLVACSFCGATCLLLITSALVYRHRWKLIYARNVWLVNLYGFRPRGRAVSGCVYDAYVVYCQADKDFALDTLLTEMEDKRGHRLCVEDRDFIPGSFNFNNITCAVQNSTVTLLLVSPAFLRDRELEYATQMALMEEYSQPRRDVLLLLNYGNPCHEDLPQDLLLLMKKGRFLDYPWPQEGEAIPEATTMALWERLSEEIGHTDNQTRPRWLDPS